MTLVNNCMQFVTCAKCVPCLEKGNYNRRNKAYIANIDSTHESQVTSRCSTAFLLHLMHLRINQPWLISRPSGNNSNVHKGTSKVATTRLAMLTLWSRWQRSQEAEGKGHRVRIADCKQRNSPISPVYYS